LILSASNNYSGGTTIANGAVVINNHDALGTGTGLADSTTVAGGATLQFQGNFSVDQQITLQGGTLESVSGTNIQAGLLTLANTSTVSVDPGVTFTIVGQVIGGGGLIKQGTGTLILNNGNNFSGGTDIENGTLQLNAAGALPSNKALTVNNGTLNLNGFN